MPYVQTLSAKKPSFQSHLGDRNCLTYNTIILGNVAYPSNAFDGAAYVFDRVGTTSYYSYVTGMSATAGSGIYYGTSQAVDTNYIYIGAPLYNSGQGAIYQYDNVGNRFKLNATITSTKNGVKGYFGSNILLNGSNMLIGAFNAETINPGAYRGAVHHYNNSGGSWTRVATLSSSSSSNGDRFGWSFSGDTSEVVVGAPFYNSQQGRIYQFRPNPLDANSWSNTQILSLNGSGGASGPWNGQTTDGTNPGSQFGHTIDKGTNYMVVGAPYFYNQGYGAYIGAAFLYVRAGILWTYASILTAKIEADSNFSEINFGTSVALNETNNTVLVGADAFDEGCGLVFGFDISNPTTPVQSFTIRRPTQVDNASFGKDIKLLTTQENGIALIGNDGALVDPDNGSIYPPQCGGALLYNQVSLITPTPSPTVTPPPTPSPTPNPTPVPKILNWYGLNGADPISFGDGGGAPGGNYPNTPSKGGTGRNYSILRELGYYGTLNSTNSSLYQLAILYNAWCVNNNLNPANPTAMSEFYSSRGVSLGFNYKVTRKLVSGGKYCTHNDGQITVNIGPVSNNTTPENNTYSGSGYIGNPLRDSTYRLSIVGDVVNVQATVTKSSGAKYITATGLHAEQAYWFTYAVASYAWSIQDETTGFSQGGNIAVGGACNGSTAVAVYKDYKTNYPANPPS